MYMVGANFYLVRTGKDFRIQNKSFRTSLCKLTSFGPDVYINLNLIFQIFYMVGVGRFFALADRQH